MKTWKLTFKGVETKTITVDAPGKTSATVKAVAKLANLGLKWHQYRLTSIVAR